MVTVRPPPDDIIHLGAVGRHSSQNTFPPSQFELIELADDAVCGNKRKRRRSRTAWNAAAAALQCERFRKTRAAAMYHFGNFVVGNFAPLAFSTRR